jgi:hypothetical protein
MDVSSTYLRIGSVTTAAHPPTTLSTRPRVSVWGAAKCVVRIDLLYLKHVFVVLHSPCSMKPASRAVWYANTSMTAFPRSFNQFDCLSDSQQCLLPFFEHRPFEADNRIIAQQIRPVPVEMSPLAITR